MDFTIQYTKEQEDFRQEVRGWMEENAQYPPELGEIPLEDGDVSREMWEWSVEFQRKLGAKGWLFPLDSKEYGGGGLTPDHDLIIQEELGRVEYPDVAAGGQQPVAALFLYGTEEQKAKLLPSFLKGEAGSWQLWTEPTGGADLANIKTRAVKDGDDFVITGEKVFVGSVFEPTYFWCLTITDPDGPRHQNMGAFLIPANSPGVTVNTLNLITRESKRHIMLDGVRVSREYLIGGETEGWRVVSSGREMEGAGLGSVGQKDGLRRHYDTVRDVIEYSKGTHRSGQPLSKDPSVQQTLVESYIDTHVQQLIQVRNYWMGNSRQPMSWHASQYSALSRMVSMGAADNILSALGPYALTTDNEWAPLEGRVELKQRQGVRAEHGAGTLETDKIKMARRLDISRTKDRAAPIRA
ncbi:hypothetical protein FIM08_01375 [SAR202 cluster bacterium AC-647-N09_OGT_505m]|nr:hypothetical protein [SAR202 cluster bacterium AC-647-N09_OGT_505m]